MSDLAIATLLLARPIAGGVFAWAVSADRPGLAAAVTLSVILADWLDGRIVAAAGAARWEGSWADPTADALFVVVAFAAMCATGWYPWWTLALIVALFVQFLLTSGRRPRYDAPGKWYGAMLFVAILVSVVFPHPGVRSGIVAFILVHSALVVGSRIALFLNPAADPSDTMRSQQS